MRWIPRQRVQATTALVMSSFWSSETAVLMTFAIIVGIGAALGTVAFIWLIGFFRGIFFDTGGQVFGFMGGAIVILIPVVGGLLVGPLIHFVAPEAKGHGVPEVMTAIATRGGRIRPIVVLAKALGSAITIGSGGSVGREGPIVQIGAALGSNLGQFFKLSDRRIITLVAAGAAAGIAATFNAPIAGVIFSLEVILGDFGIQMFTSIVVAAVTASALSRALIGDTPAFAVPAYTLVSPWELPLYLGLGVVAGLAALFFVKVLYWFEDTFDEWKFPPYLKPAVGGLGLGILGYFVPQIFGTGFDTVTQTLNGTVTLTLLVILVFAKVLATSLTLGSGASGGVFAPALFIGAVLGGAYGNVAHLIFPDITATSGAYAMVGMAAVFAGAARAPITAIIILFEMTHDYRIILPLMFAVVVSTVLSQHFEAESIYTIKLKRRGIDVRARDTSNPMRTIMVQDAMTPLAEVTTVKSTTSLGELARMFQATSHHGFVVMDDAGKLFGIVALSDFERALAANETSNTVIEGTVADICTTQVLTVYADETLNDAVRHFGAMDVGRIPVVERHNPGRIVGLLRRGDIIHAYSTALLDTHEQSANLDRLKLESTIGAELVELSLNFGDNAVDKALKDIAVPPNSVIISIRRGHEVIIPRGTTILRTRDRVLFLSRGVPQARLQQVLRAGKTEGETG